MLLLIESQVEEKEREREREREREKERDKYTREVGKKVGKVTILRTRIVIFRFFIDDIFRSETMLKYEAVYGSA